MNAVWDLLQYSFVQRGLLAGVFVAAGCALLGVFLVLKRMSMVGDGLSHVAFGAIGLALFMNWAPLALALPIAAMASLVILLLPERAGFHGDAAIGMVSVTGVAVGVLLASLGGGFNVDLFSFLFGDILAVSRMECRLAVGVALGCIGTILFFYNDLFALTFDETAARVSGIRPAPIHRMLSALTAVMVVLGIRVVGTLLVSSLLIFPVVTALQICRSFRGLLLASAALGMASVIGGIGLSLAFDTPSGATIVLLHALLFCFAFVFRRR